MRPVQLYRERLAERQEEASRLLAAERRMSIARLVAVALAVAAAALSQRVLFALFLATFIALVVIHERLVRRRTRAERSARFYEAGLERVNGTWFGKGVSGEGFRDDHHPYSSDLDLFGDGSLFERICLAVTAAGQAKLAGWLTHPAGAAEVRERQKAVAELRDDVDFREAMALAAGDARETIEHGKLEGWATAPAVPYAPWERIVALLLPVATIASVIATLAGANFIVAVIVFTAAQLLFARRLSERVNLTVSGVERAEPALGRLARLLELMGRSRDAAAIERLRRLVGLLDARRNQMFAPIGILLLWATNLAARIERWRRAHGGDVVAWIDAVAEKEALSSLASFAYENPAFAMPEIADSGRCFAATALGHPLIPEGRRICNDLRLDEQLRLLVISGSNMSGKSTLLRSTGVAAVLAFAGAPVCAKSLRIAPMTVGASIRINDSLQEGASRFYAEILRIRQILDLAREERPLLFLLDEILHGTNSHDRRIGAEGVVRRLVEGGAIGLVSTHDLALAEIVTTLAPHAENVHFEDHLEEGKMIFDYRMRPGVVTRSNALELMRSVGIEV
jgi:hypothetical protein